MLDTAPLVVYPGPRRDIPPISNDLIGGLAGNWPSRKWQVQVWGLIGRFWELSLCHSLPVFYAQERALLFFFSWFYSPSEHIETGFKVSILPTLWSNKWSSIEAHSDLSTLIYVPELSKWHLTDKLPLHPCLWLDSNSNSNNNNNNNNNKALCLSFLFWKLSSYHNDKEKWLPSLRHMQTTDDWWL